MNHNQQITNAAENLTHLYFTGRISLQDVFDIKFHFSENEIKMTAGIAGFADGKPVIVICPEIEFDSFVNDVRKEIYREPIISKIFRFLIDVFGK